MTIIFEWRENVIKKKDALNSNFGLEVCRKYFG